MTETRHKMANEDIYRLIATHMYTCIPHACIYSGTYARINIKLERENTRVFTEDYCSGAVICNFFFLLFSVLLILYNKNEKEEQDFLNA